MSSRKKFYAVLKGRVPGIYESWAECREMVQGFSGCQFKGFEQLEDAKRYMQQQQQQQQQETVLPQLPETVALEDAREGHTKKRKRDELGTAADDLTNIVDYKAKRLKLEERISWLRKELREREDELEDLDSLEALEELMREKEKKNGQAEIKDEQYIVAYTDGSHDNGRAGIGIWYGPEDPRNLSEKMNGLVTSQRAELYAAIRALERTSRFQNLEIRSDSRYLVLGMTEWMPRWIQRNWKVPILNQDLWKRLNELCSQREAKVRWTKVRAHCGIPGNEGADQLAKSGLLLPSNKVSGEQ